MAGTKQYVENLTGYVAQTVLSSASDEKNSLEGIDVSGLTDRAECYVREFFATYRYFDDSVLAPAFPFVIAPAVGPGRWLLVGIDGGGIVQPAGDFAGGPPAGPIALPGTAAGLPVFIDAPFVMTPSAANFGFSALGAGVVRYDGVIPQRFQISATLSMTHAEVGGVSLFIAVSAGGVADQRRIVGFAPEDTPEMLTTHLIQTLAPLDTVVIRVAQGTVTPGPVSADLLVGSLSIAPV